jgi:DNA-binding transcriptional ArsR family regulator
MDTEEATQIFKALSDPTRLRLIQLLAQQERGSALCVMALADRLEVSQPAVSQHLRVLRNLGVVRGERRGFRVHYFLDQDQLAKWREIASEALGKG